jgi:hypothetical protein
VFIVKKIIILLTALISILFAAVLVEAALDGCCKCDDGQWYEADNVSECASYCFNLTGGFYENFYETCVNNTFYCGNNCTASIGICSPTGFPGTDFTACKFADEISWEDQCTEYCSSNDSFFWDAPHIDYYGCGMNCTLHSSNKCRTEKTKLVVYSAYACTCEPCVGGVCYNSDDENYCLTEAGRASAKIYNNLCTVSDDPSTEPCHNYTCRVYADVDGNCQSFCEEQPHLLKPGAYCCNLGEHLAEVPTPQNGNITWQNMTVDHSCAVGSCNDCVCITGGGPEFSKIGVGLSVTAVAGLVLLIINKKRE